MNQTLKQILITFGMMKPVIYLMSDDRFNTLIMAGVAILTSITGTITAIIVAGRRADKQNAEVVSTVVASNTQVAAEVGVLAKNIDGATREIKDTIAAKSLAEGKLEGIAGEQDRVAETRPERHAVDAVAEDIAENGKK